MSELLLLAIPAFFGLMLLEAAVLSRRKQQNYEARDTAASLAMGLGNLGIQLGWKGLALGFLVWLHQFALFDLGGAWWVWLLLFFADDFCYYWFHRVHHEVRLFWAAHVNHHSSERYNLSTALRQSWTTPFTWGFFYWPLPLLGFDPLMIVSMGTFSLLYQFWIHTEAIDRLGPLEWVLNTPSHHRVHHGSNPQYLDRNYGGFTIVFDRLFGSFEPEVEPVHYGLTKNIQTFNPLRIAFHEWAAMFRDAFSAGNLGDAWRYCAKHPGWKARSEEPMDCDASVPDGSALV